MDKCETPCASVAGLIEKVSGHELLFQQHVKHGREKLSEFGLQIKECVDNLKDGAERVNKALSDNAVNNEKQNARLREGDTRFQSVEKDLQEVDDKVDKLVDAISAQGLQQKKRLRPAYAGLFLLTVFLFSTEHGPELGKWIKFWTPW